MQKPRPSFYRCSCNKTRCRNEVRNFRLTADLGKLGMFCVFINNEIHYNLYRIMLSPTQNVCQLLLSIVKMTFFVKSWEQNTEIFYNKKKKINASLSLQWMMFVCTSKEEVRLNRWESHRAERQKAFCSDISPSHVLVE